ncbi:MAG: radical SAM/SPASM domain-containing protein [Candidatus Aenigmatarchaeota archaeon]
MNSKVKRIYDWKEGRKRGPVRMELHPTDRCNLDCRFCWRKGDNEIQPEMELSEEKLLDVVDEAAELGVKEWIISGGGEPMIRKETTMRVLERIKKHGMWGQLTTNGTLFDEGDVEKLVEIGWDQVQISIDAPDARTHDFIRQGKEAFMNSIRTSKMIHKCKIKKGKKIPFLGYNTIITRQNHNKLEEMVELAYNAGSQLVYFEPIYPGYTSEIRMELNSEERVAMKKHIRKAKKLADVRGINTNVDEYLDKYSIKKDSFDERVLNKVENSRSGFLGAPCYQPWYLMGIKGSGLAGCCSTFEDGLYIHDKSLKEVWFSEKFNEKRREMLKKKIPDYCSKCSVVVLKSNEEIRRKLKEYSENRLPLEFKNKFLGSYKWMRKLTG